MSAIKNDKTESNQDSKTSKMKLPVTSVNGFEPLTDITKNYIKDIGWVPDPPCRNNKKDTPNVHPRGRTNQIKRKLDDDTTP